jgi:hypothetical protein
MCSEDVLGLGLVARLSTHDTRSELERAAWERYWDGVTLATDAGVRSTGAIYLLGYVAQVTLKSAYYRVRQVPATQDLSAELRGLRARATVLGVNWQGNWHNLDSLARLLVTERRVREQAMDPMFEATFQGHVRVVSLNWTETLRYKDTRAESPEVEAVYDSTDWLLINYENLWS